MLKIRLQRIGRKGMPVFRLVVAEHTSPVAGKFHEKLGGFIGGQKATTLQIDLDRAKHWLSVGAEPSETVARLLVSQGVKEAEKFVKKRIQQTPKAELEAAAKAKEEAEAKAAADAEAKAAKEAEAAAAAEAKEADTEEAPAEEEAAA